MLDVGQWAEFVPAGLVTLCDANKTSAKKADKKRGDAVRRQPIALPPTLVALLESFGVAPPPTSFTYGQLERMAKSSQCCDVATYATVFMHCGREHCGSAVPRGGVLSAAERRLVLTKPVPRALVMPAAAASAAAAAAAGAAAAASATASTTKPSYLSLRDALELNSANRQVPTLDATGKQTSVGFATAAVARDMYLPTRLAAVYAKVDGDASDILSSDTAAHAARFMCASADEARAAIAHAKEKASNRRNGRKSSAGAAPRPTAPLPSGGGSSSSTARVP